MDICCYNCLSSFDKEKEKFTNVNEALNWLKFICDKIATKKNATQKNLENENKI